MPAKRTAMPGDFKYDKLAALVQENGLTPGELGTRLQTDQGTVRRWIKGTAVPWPKHLHRLATIFNIDPAELYYVDPAERGLAYYRVLAGFSLTALAAVVGVHPVYLGRMELGQSPVPDRVFEQLREYLNLSTEGLDDAISISEQMHQLRLQASPPRTRVPIPCEVVHTGPAHRHAASA